LHTPITFGAVVVIVPELRRLKPLALGPVGALAALTLALHFWVNATTPYGFHRDEFLYLAMGRHLQLWAMDFPPGIALLAEATRALLGDSLVAIRAGPALAGAALVVAAALFARSRAGAGAGAQLPPRLARSSFAPPTCSSPSCSIIDVTAAFALMRLWKPDGAVARPGLALGIGLLVKFGIASSGWASSPGSADPARRSPLTRWPWVALAVAPRWEPEPGGAMAARFRAEPDGRLRECSSSG
jgi:hypothetical protein